MAKFHGKLGYGITGETKPGVWVDQIIEKDVVGDFIKNTDNLKIPEELMIILILTIVLVL